jgi:hypothetical protein
VYAEEVKKKILDPCGVIFGKRSEPMRHTDLSIKLLSKLKLADNDTLIVDDTQGLERTQEEFTTDRSLHATSRRTLFFFSEEG